MEVNPSRIEMIVVKRELIRTAIQSARKIQRMIEDEAADLDVSLSIYPSAVEGDADFYLTVEPIDESIGCLANESPAIWLAEVRSIVADYRAELASPPPSSLGFGDIDFRPSPN